MKKLFFIIFLMAFSFAISANAKKPKVVWPKAVLTLKDGTVLNGYLQNDIHFMKKNIYFSEIQNGKDVKYKIFDDSYKVFYLKCLKKRKYLRWATQVLSMTIESTFIGT